MGLITCTYDVVIIFRLLNSEISNCSFWQCWAVFLILWWFDSDVAFQEVVKVTFHSTCLVISENSDIVVQSLRPPAK